MKVEIRTTRSKRNEERARVEVFIDGQRVGGGRVGGEPEDNTIDRDYGWITDAIEAVASKLGADVEQTEGAPY